MSLRRRVFSNETDMSFDEYLSSKKGIEILKTMKNQLKNNRNVKIQNNNIISYLSYNDFLNLSKTFFNNTYKKDTNCNAPFSISNIKTSYICYEKINAHIKNCSLCKNNTDVNSLCNCKEIKNILYPYGNYYATEKQLFFPNKINLNEWCNLCKNNKNCDCNKNNISENNWNNDDNNSNTDINYDFDESTTNTDINYDFDESNTDTDINYDFDDSSSDVNIDYNINTLEYCNDCDCTPINNNTIYEKKNISCNEYDDRYFIKMKNKLERINNKSYEIKMPKNDGNKKIKYCGICNKTTKFFI